jgi:hypothetical protein
MRQLVCQTHGPAPDYLQWLAPIAGATSVGALAGQVSKGNPFVMFAGALGGLWLGAQGAKRCPQCGELLQVIDIIGPFLA